MLYVIMAGAAHETAVLRRQLNLLNHEYGYDKSEWPKLLWPLQYLHHALVIVTALNGMQFCGSNQGTVHKHTLFQHHTCMYTAKLDVS